MRETRPLRAYAEIVLGRQRSPKYDTGPHMVPYLRAANVKDGFLELDDVKEMNFTPEEQRVFALEPGDVLVTEGSGSLRAVGASSVWMGELPGTICFQNTLLRLRPRPRTDPRFLAWWCRYAFADGLFASAATGANIFHLSADRLRGLPLTYVGLEEQRAIADFLDVETARIDALIDKKRRLIALLTERLRSRRDGWYERLAERHGTIRLRVLASSIEQGWSPVCDGVPAGVDEWGVLKTSSVTSGRFKVHENKRLPADVEPDRRWQVADGDLLLARGSGSRDNVGIACVARPEARRLTISDLIYRLKLDRFTPDFVATALQSSQVRADTEATIRTDVGQTLKLRRDDIGNMRVPNVPVALQDAAVNEIVHLLVMHDRTVDNLEQQITLLGEKRRALITAAVTGEFAVPGTSAA